MSDTAKSFKVGEDVVYTVVREKNNDVIGRVEIQVRIDHIRRGTPSREEVVDAVSKMFSVDKSLIVVKKIVSVYGRGTSIARVNIYRSEETLRKFEPKYLIERLQKKSDESKE